MSKLSMHSIDNNLFLPSTNLMVTDSDAVRAYGANGFELTAAEPR